MKKITALFLSLALLAGVTACGGGDAEAADTDPLELLTAVWDGYDDADKFAVYGGGPDEGDIVDGGPGAFDLADPEALDTALGFPAGEAGKIDAAASLVHMLNANSFTCGAFRAGEGEDVSALAQAVEDNIADRQWLCGFPEQLTEVLCGNCLVVCFGAKDLTDVFLSRLYDAFPDAVTVCDQPIL